MLWGRQIIKVSHGEMAIRYDVKITGLTKKYNINEMTDIKTQNTVVTFRHRNKTEKIGIMTSKEDALKLEGFMRQCLPQGKFEEQSTANI